MFIYYFLIFIFVVLSVYIQMQSQLLIYRQYAYHIHIYYIFIYIYTKLRNLQNTLSSPQASDHQIPTKMNTKKQQIILDIPTTSISQLQNFPNDPNTDVKIVYKSKTFNLQKCVLRTYSKYFAKLFDANFSTGTVIASDSHMNVGKIAQNYANKPTKNQSTTQKTPKVSNSTKLPTPPQQKIKVTLQSKNSANNSETPLLKIEIHDIKNLQDDKKFSNILSLLYGNTLTIQRSQISEYLQLCLYLQIEILIKQLLTDIHDNIEQHDIFIILKLAHENKLQELQKLCIQQLQNQEFQQLKYNQLSLLNIDCNLFKKIIRLHNAYKKEKKKGVSHKTILEIVRLYSQANNFSVEQALQVKFDTIQIQGLSSYQFKVIFGQPFDNKIKNIQQIVHRNESNHHSKLNGLSDQLETKFKKYGKTFVLILSKIEKNPNCAGEQLYNVQQIKNYVQNIYLSKKVKQLQKTVEKLTTQNNQLKLLHNGNLYLQTLPENRKRKGSTVSRRGQQLKIQPKIPKQIIKQLPTQKQKQKQKQIPLITAQKQKIQITKIISVIDKINHQFNQKIEQMSQIVNSYQKNKKQIINRPRVNSSLSCRKSSLSQNKQKQMQEQQLQSFGPRTYTTQISANSNDSKNYGQSNQSLSSNNSKNSRFKRLNSLNTEVVSCKISNQVMYSENGRLFFNSTPLTVSLQLINNLSQMLVQSGFKKKSCYLLYRRSNSNISNSNSNKYPIFGQQSCIYNKQSLLILIKAKNQECIGGYISTKITKEKEKEKEQTQICIQDKNACILNLGRMIKCKISQKAIKSAIKITSNTTTITSNTNNSKYLLQFSSDLQIPKQITKNKAKSIWSQDYQCIINRNRNKPSSKQKQNQPNKQSIDNNSINTSVYTVKSINNPSVNFSQISYKAQPGSNIAETITTTTTTTNTGTTATSHQNIQVSGDTNLSITNNTTKTIDSNYNEYSNRNSGANSNTNSNVSYPSSTYAYSNVNTNKKDLDKEKYQGLAQESGNYEKEGLNLLGLEQEFEIQLMEIFQIREKQMEMLI